MSELSKKKVILAVDTADITIAKKYILQAQGLCYGIKLGLEFFVANGLIGLIDVQQKFSVPIFLDLKLHDIPNTVIKSIEALHKNVDIDMLTVHISGGQQMLSKIALLKQNNKMNTKILGVTLLTSLSEEDIENIGIVGSSLADNVINMAQIAYRSGLDGVVCSGYESKMIKNKFHDKLLTVVPGIRAKELHGDQKRVMTPNMAVKNLADYLVVGREITSSTNMADAINNLFLL